MSRSKLKATIQAQNAPAVVCEVKQGARICEMIRHMCIADLPAVEIMDVSTKDSM